MRKLITAALLVVALAACGQQSNFADKEAFVDAFLSALIADDPGRLEPFFVTESDFREDAANKPNSAQLEQARNTFLTSAQRLATDLRDRKITVKEILFSENNPQYSANIKDVLESYRNVKVSLQVDDQHWEIIIAEVLNTGGQWRMTGFFTTVDLGTETRDMVEIEIPAEQEKKITEEK